MEELFSLPAFPVVTLRAEGGLEAGAAARFAALPLRARLRRAPGRTGTAPGGAGETRDSPGPAPDSPCGSVVAAPPVPAGQAGALVHVVLAEVALEARSAGAGEGARGIATGRAVQAGLRQALVDLQLAVRTCGGKESRQAPHLARCSLLRLGRLHQRARVLFMTVGTTTFLSA